MSFGCAWRFAPKTLASPIEPPTLGLKIPVKTKEWKVALKGSGAQRRLNLPQANLGNLQVGRSPSAFMRESIEPPTLGLKIPVKTKEWKVALKGSGAQRRNLQSV
jgi:hypothetical protein